MNTKDFPVCVRFFRFTLSGISAFGVNLAFLALFTGMFDMWYLTSAVAAFLIAFFVSFALHKFWTFGDHSRDGLHVQMGMYLLVAVINLGLNTLSVYLFVEWAGFHYLVAQTVAGAFIAIENFFVSQRVIFRRSNVLSA